MMRLLIVSEESKIKILITEAMKQGVSKEDFLIWTKEQQKAGSK
jgi:hypothetical protein